MAQINSTQDYDAIHTLTFASASGTCNIRLYRGSWSTYTGTVYYRAGTSGAWTSLSVSGGSTTFNVTSTTMQVAHDWNKDGNNYMTPSFYGQTTNLTDISISQKAVLSGTVGDYFMQYYAYNCTSLTSLDVPDTSGLTSAGYYFMQNYAYNCTSLTSLDVPDTSGFTTTSYGFMQYYAYNCTSLTSLDVPDTSGLTSVGNYFMSSYAEGCSSLTSLSVPDTSGVTSVGGNFMYYYAYRCSSLTSLSVPDTSGVTSVGNDFMSSYAEGCSSLTSLSVPDTSGPTSVGDYFMYHYAYGCSSLTSLSVPDTSGLTSVGNYFMAYYANVCSSLTSLSVPDTSGVTSVGTNFMYCYARNCSSLTSLSVPDTSGLTSVGNYFMSSYAIGCSSLTSLSVPDASGLTSVGTNFMLGYAQDCSSLTSLILPDSTGWFGSHNVNWSIPSTRLGYLNGIASSSSAGTAWEGLIDEGETLYTNYIRSVDNVLLSASSDRLLYTKGRVTTYSERGLYTRGRITVGDDSVTVCDSYAESNQSSFTILHTGDWIEWGQSFTGSGGILDSVKFYLYKKGTPPGVVVAKVYAHSGVFGTKSLPTGDPLAVSDNVTATTLETSFALTTFAFSGANRITLTSGERYVVTIFYNDGTSSNYIAIGVDLSSPTHSGNSCGYTSFWQGLSSYDTPFYVYTVSTYSRLLYTKGGLAGDSDRLLYSKGISTGSSDRGLFSKGIASSDSDRLIYTKGIATSSSDRLLYSKGKVAGSSEIPIYTEGFETDNSERGVYSRAGIPSSSTGNLYTKGTWKPWVDKFVEYGTIYTDEEVVVGGNFVDLTMSGGDTFVNDTATTGTWVDVKAPAADNFIRKV